jgi:hypothetical protein
VGGQTAFMINMADAVAVRLPWVILGVIVAAGILLLVMFRARLVALKATLMTLLSVGASYGVIVAVFQWGWGLSLLGLDQPVPTIDETLTKMIGGGGHRRRHHHPRRPRSGGDEPARPPRLVAAPPPCDHPGHRAAGRCGGADPRPAEHRNRNQPARCPHRV